MAESDTTTSGERRKPLVRGVNHWTIRADNAVAAARAILAAHEAGTLLGIRVVPYDDAEANPQVKLRLWETETAAARDQAQEFNDSILCPPFLCGGGG
jgi:hypothetical protein